MFSSSSVWLSQHEAFHLRLPHAAVQLSSASSQPHWACWGSLGGWRCDGHVGLAASGGEGKYLWSYWEWPQPSLSGVGNCAGTLQMLRATGSAFLSTLLRVFIERLQRGVRLCLHQDAANRFPLSSLPDIEGLEVEGLGCRKGWLCGQGWPLQN